MTEVRVAVAGGGIGGLALGIALRRAGIAVTVVERAERIADVGAGLVLGPNAVKALDAISPRLGRAVRDGGHLTEPGQARPIVDPSGTVQATDPIGDLDRRFGAPQVSLLRSALQAVLLREATATGVNLLTGAEVDGHVDRGDRVDVTLSDGSTLTADVLVGADGVRSVVRRQLFADGPPTYCGYTSLRARTTAPREYPYGVVANGERVHLFCAPIGRGEVYWTAKIIAPRDAWPAKDPATAHADLLGLLDGWHRPIVEMVGGIGPGSGLLITDVSDRDPIPEWTVGRVTLLGDAAHPMAPSLGQGAGMALEDAVVLARCLAGHGEVAAALAAYTAERVPRTTSVVWASRQDRTVSYEGRDAQQRLFAELYGWQPDRAQPAA